MRCLGLYHLRTMQSVAGYKQLFGSDKTVLRFGSFSFCTWRISSDTPYLHESHVETFKHLKCCHSKRIIKLKSKDNLYWYKNTELKMSN